MKNIVFIAAPAAGKGTQSNLLVENYNFIHISTGDLLRDEANKDTEEGRLLKEMLVTGKLISDDIVNDLLKKKLQETSDKPKIFDGYPRNIEQAKLLDNLLDNYIVIYLDVDEATAVNRIINRLICPSCHKVYNTTTLKPKEEGLCDNCHTSLIKRKDDNATTFKTRFLEYLENTRPLLDYYKKSGKLIVISGKEDEQTIYKKIEKLLEE